MLYQKAGKSWEHLLKELLEKRKYLNKLDLTIIFYCFFDVFLALIVFLSSQPENPETTRISFLIEIFKDRLGYLLLSWFSFTTLTQDLSLRELKKVLLGFALSGSFVSLFVVAQFLFPEFREIKIRLLQNHSFAFHSGIFTNCALLILSSFACLHLSFYTRFSKKLLSEFFFFAFLAHFAALLLIGQKSCILGISGGLLFWLFRSWSKLKINLKLLIAFSLILTPSLIISFYEPVRLTFLQMLEPSLDASSYDCRLKLWRENFQAYKQDSLWQQIFGDGKLVQGKCFGVKLTYAHNIFLQKLFVGGLLSLINLLFLILVLLREFSRVRDFNQAFLGALIALLLEGLFEDWISFATILIALIFCFSLFLKRRLKT